MKAEDRTQEGSRKESESLKALAALVILFPDFGLLTPVI
jgi:hypothetical protein